MSKQIEVYIEQFDNNPLKVTIPEDLTIEKLKEHQPRLQSCLILVSQGREGRDIIRGNSYTFKNNDYLRIIPDK